LKAIHLNGALINRSGCEVVDKIKLPLTYRSLSMDGSNSNAVVFALAILRVILKLFVIKHNINR